MKNACFQVEKRKDYMRVRANNTTFVYYKARPLKLLTELTKFTSTLYSLEYSLAQFYLLAHLFMTFSNVCYHALAMKEIY